MRHGSVWVASPLQTSEALQTLSSMRENATTAEALAYHCRDKSYLSGRQVYGVLMPFEERKPAASCRCSAGVKARTYIGSFIQYKYPIPSSLAQDLS